MMNFTLNKIKALFEMREDVRLMTQQKLDDIEQQIAELNVLRQELQLLLGACCCSQQECPILENIDGINRSEIC